jgi:hypothetical protein
MDSKVLFVIWINDMKNGEYYGRSKTGKSS